MNPTVVERPIVQDQQVPEVVHGAHLTCQWDMPYVTTVCGTHAGWDDEVDLNLAEMCVVCRDLVQCPVCGTRLELPR